MKNKTAILKLAKNDIKLYAYKYFESRGRNINRLSYKDIKKTLSKCVLPPKDWMIKFIKKEIIFILKEEKRNNDFLSLDLLTND
jgi:hypothetical protein